LVLWDFDEAGRIIGSVAVFASVMEHCTIVHK